MSLDPPPIADLALIADGDAAALVSSRGEIEWCCLPRIDSGAVFARLLDPLAGHCGLGPAAPASVTRRYLPDTLVLETSFTTESGRLRLQDCFTLESGRPWRPGRRLLRVADCTAGSVEVAIAVSPRFQYGEARPWLRRIDELRWSAIAGSDALDIQCDAPLSDDGPHDLGAVVTLGPGDRLHLSITWHPPHRLAERLPAADAAAALDGELAATTSAWRGWGARLQWAGPAELDPRRSALVLRALTRETTGAMAAAPTTSLPESPGGQRNWDYRFSWIRDSQFAARALAELGADREAGRFRRFVERSAGGSADELQIMFGLGGQRRLTESELPLAGYGGARPVRIGNAAARQLQLDVHGELLDLAWAWHQRGHSPEPDYWRFLTGLVDTAAERWSEPDRGLWELRGPPRHLVHSKVMCWVAVDRGVRLAVECGLPGPLDRWAQARDRIRDAVLDHGVDRRRSTFVQEFGGTEVDAALLLLPGTGFVADDDPLTTGTIEAVRSDLADGGLLRRYRADDALDGEEGAFIACSFWLAESLARQGRAAEARGAFDRAAATANDLGLFSEEFDTHTGSLLGNFPQALTHLSHIRAAVALVNEPAGGIRRVG